LKDIYCVLKNGVLFGVSVRAIDDALKKIMVIFNLRAYP